MQADRKKTADEDNAVILETDTCSHLLLPAASLGCESIARRISVGSRSGGPHATSRHEKHIAIRFEIR